MIQDNNQAIVGFINSLCKGRPLEYQKPYQEHPLVAPHVMHFKHVPLRTLVMLDVDSPSARVSTTETKTVDAPASLVLQHRTSTSLTSLNHPVNLSQILSSINQG